MQKLNLPPCDLKITHADGVEKVFDVIRGNHIVLTPEEWVRQHFIHFLMNALDYPGGLMMVEKELKIGTLKRRPDLVVFNKQGAPRLIAEFKAPEIKITEDTFFQIALYNKKLQVPYLILSNGIEHYCAKIDLPTGQLTFINDFPSFKEL